MTRHRLELPVLARACGVAALMLAVAVPVAAQGAQSTQSAQSVTATDIQRLQDQVYEASRDLTRLGGNTDAMGRLQTELDDARDEVAYLKVKLRKEGKVNRAEFNDVQRRVQDLRSRARADMRGSDNTGGWRTNSDQPGTTGSRSGGTGTGVYGGVGDERTRPEQGTRPDQNTRTGSNNSVIPSGQEIDVRLETELSSDTAQVEQRFEATTVADLYRGNDVLIPAGSVLRGVVSSVTKATRMERKGSLTVAFDQISIHGRTYPMRGIVTQALESEGIRGEAPKIGAGAGIGAIIGGIIGGVKGALLGVLIGGGGTIAATEGKDVTLPAGTILRVRLDTPPAIR